MGSGDQRGSRPRAGAEQAHRQTSDGGVYPDLRNRGTHPIGRCRLTPPPAARRATFTMDTGYPTRHRRTAYRPTLHPHGNELQVKPREGKRR